MAYLIDGHNLIGQMRDLRLDDPDDEARLVEQLNRYMLRHNRRCTVVFDRGLPGGRAVELSTSRVEVVFAHGGTNADRIILERVGAARDARRWQIVSDDRAIVDEARRRGMQVLSAREFAARLGAARAPGNADDEDPNPHISPDDVAYWQREFSRTPRKPPAR
mgnify:CR=1 FL=1